MKKTLFFITFLTFVFDCPAQTEAKINPVGLLFLDPELSVEFGITKNIALEPSLGLSYGKSFLWVDDFNSKAWGYGLNSKYYFNSEKGFDKFYAGMYLRGEQRDFTSKDVNAGFSYMRNFFALGFSLGYKLVSKQNIVFDLGLGIGKKLVYHETDPVSTSTVPTVIEIQQFESPIVDGFMRFGVGYRFGRSRKKPK
ncbi:MAG: DUF3575 domain-containing protein [Saprospiraceae bacterium]|nr:DUF3575 domain-containing protein [Saprospiraceae bacterium]